MATPDFDVDKTKVRFKQIEKLFEAHSIPNDRETAIALFVSVTQRLVSLYGPMYLSGCASMFIDVWRRYEAEVVTDALQSVVAEEMLKAMTTDDIKH